MNKVKEMNPSISINQFVTINNGATTKCLFWRNSNVNEGRNVTADVKF